MTQETKLIDGYWVIGSNKWTASTYSQNEAEKYAETLISCYNCINCSDCSYCSDCRGCRGCSGCSSCRDCLDCRGCRNFKTNPQRIVSPKLGSRDSQTTYYWNEDKEQIVCGCFKGTLQEFEAKVKETHGDNDFAKGYLNWIEKVKTYKL